MILRLLFLSVKDRSRGRDWKCKGVVPTMTQRPCSVGNKSSERYRQCGSASVGAGKLLKHQYGGFPWRRHSSA